MKVTTQVLGVALIALLAVACKNTKYKKTKEGFPYTVISDGKGEKIELGKVARYHVTNKLGDSILMTSYGSPARWAPIPKTGEVQGLGKILLEARKGDSIIIIQPVDSLIAQAPQKPVTDSFLLNNKGKEIRTYLRIVEVYKDESAARDVFEKENMETYFKDPAMAAQREKDNSVIEAYLKSNNITTKKSPWGVYIQTVTPGNGKRAEWGQYMNVKYTGKLFNGEIFDSGVYPLQLGGGGSIIGFEDAVKQLSKGEKAVAYIPSVIAYGSQGNLPKIAPDQNLIFELELLDISDQPAQPQMPPTPPTTDTPVRK